MEKWKHESLLWIHKVREENYGRTKGLTPEQLIDKTRAATEAAVNEMGLKIVRPKESVRTR